MRFTLVVCTFGRSKELWRLFDSLAEQSFRDFEVILVDQNQDDRFDSIGEAYGYQFSLVHLHMSERGLSRGRNLALHVARGQLIGFPDDDCWYAPDTLERISKAFDTLACDGLNIRILNEFGLAQNRIPSRIMPINLVNLSINSNSMFFTKTFATSVGSFDCNVGAGAGTVWSGGDDVDFFIAALKHIPQSKLLYFPDAVVFHPNMTDTSSLNAFEKSYSYGRSIGYVLRKHSLHRLFFTSLVRSSLFIFRQMVLLNWPKARFRILDVAGRIKGWLEQPGNP
jgi:glycosyltransferase involved in cell wall biosynthesis